ncbi:MAG TPA: hypothetical protein VEQ10_14355, partial [Vicinamibacteria bacterium]|nr:hypothetical protein [Vicinamibacteria bacterium]
PLDPTQRYNAFVPVVFQPVFDASNYTATFSAYSGVPSTLKWEASAQLTARMNSSWSGGANSTFAQLHGGATPNTIGSSAALIKRRIYTTSGNGVFTATGRTPVALWPPTTSGAGAVAPASDTTAGGVDGPLGIVGTGDATEFANLQATYGACLGSPLVTACSGTVAQQVARARREAREQILAFTAGAVKALDANANPLRSSASGSTGEILYQPRSGSLIAETTLATPAVITPPVQNATNAHNTEYVEFRDGPRNGANAVNGIDYGFGLRNPDYDGTTASANNNALKPVMTVVYLPTNQMLHAFRAGSCPGSTCSDVGGEELWGFVPFDQLGKLAGRIQKQKRDPHTYALAASLRFADVFVPETFSQSVGGVTVSLPGTWRTILYFGRGIGGKYLTALDVTVPGPATRAAMGSTAINPPLVMWNRGNPDTVDGTTGGTANNTTADKTAYAKMGETWSVPAVVRVNATDNPTTRKPVTTGCSSCGVEFVAYVGSGYSATSTEGSTFYALDALTGDVVASFDVGDRTTGAIFPDNAIVAPPAALTPDTFNQPGSANATLFVNPSEALATRVYVGDIHGRLWRFPTTATGITNSSQTAAPAANAGGLFADFGANQPVANGVGLLYYNSDNTGAKPHVYVEAGNDQRVTPPGDLAPFATTPPFNMYGLRDEDLTSDPDSSDGVNGPARVLFVQPFPNSPPPGYRGTVQPAAAFNSQGLGRVFFAGTQFTPAGTECVSSLDSVLFALTGVAGDAAFDLNATGQDKYIQLPDQLITDIQIVRQNPTSGQLNISRGIGGIGAPPPVPGVPQGKNAAPPTHGDVYPLDIRLSSSACQ